MKKLLLRNTRREQRQTACERPAGQRKAAGRFSIIGPEGEDEKLATTLHEAAERGQHREIVRRGPAAARAGAQWLRRLPRT